MVNSLWLKYKIETKLMFVMVTHQKYCVYRYLGLDS